MVFVSIIDGDSDNIEKPDVEMKPGTNASSLASSAAASRKGSKKKFFSRLKIKVKRTASDPVDPKNRYSNQGNLFLLSTILA